MSDDGFDQALFDLQVTLNNFHVSLPAPPLKPQERFCRDYEDICKQKKIPYNQKKADTLWYELQASLKSGIYFNNKKFSPIDYSHLFQREFFTYEKLKAMEVIINRNQKKLNAWNIYLEQEKKQYKHLKYSEYEPILRQKWRDLTPAEQASYRSLAPKVLTVEEKQRAYEEFELLKQEYLSKSTDIPRDLEFYDKMNDVEMIIGYRKNPEGLKEYLIKWKGKSGKDATWIEKSKLRPLRTMIQYYQSTFQNPDQISNSSFSDDDGVFPLYPDPDNEADKTKQGKGKKSKKNKSQDQEEKQNTISDDDDSKIEHNPVFGLFEKQVMIQVPEKGKKKTRTRKQAPEKNQLQLNLQKKVEKAQTKEVKTGKGTKESKQKIAPKPVAKKIQKKKVETPKVLETKVIQVSRKKQPEPVQETKPPASRGRGKPKQVVQVEESTPSSETSPSEQQFRRGRSKKVVQSSDSSFISSSMSLEVIQPTKKVTKLTIRKGPKQQKKVKEESEVEVQIEEKPIQTRKPKKPTPKEIVKEVVTKYNKKQPKENTKQTKETNKEKTQKTKAVPEVKITRRGAKQVDSIQKAIRKRR